MKINTLIMYQDISTIIDKDIVLEYKGGNIEIIKKAVD